MIVECLRCKGRRVVACSSCDGSGLSKKRVEDARKKFGYLGSALAESSDKTIAIQHQPGASTAEVTCDVRPFDGVPRSESSRWTLDASGTWYPVEPRER